MAGPGTAQRQDEPVGSVQAEMAPRAQGRSSGIFQGEGRLWWGLNTGMMPSEGKFRNTTLAALWLVDGGEGVCVDLSVCPAPTVRAALLLSQPAPSPSPSAGQPLELGDAGGREYLFLSPSLWAVCIPC